MENVFSHIFSCHPKTLNSSWASLRCRTTCVPVTPSFSAHTVNCSWQKNAQTEGKNNLLRHPEAQQTQTFRSPFVLEPDMDKVLEINAWVLHFYKQRKYPKINDFIRTLCTHCFLLGCFTVSFVKPPPRVLRFRTVSCVLSLRLGGMLIEF